MLLFFLYLQLVIRCPIAVCDRYIIHYLNIKKKKKWKREGGCVTPPASSGSHVQIIGYRLLFFFLKNPFGGEFPKGISLGPYRANKTGPFTWSNMSIIMMLTLLSWERAAQKNGGGGLVANVQRTSLLSQLFILHKTLRHRTIRNHMHRAGSHEIQIPTDIVEIAWTQD